MSSPAAGATPEKAGPGLLLTKTLPRPSCKIWSSRQDSPARPRPAIPNAGVLWRALTGLACREVAREAGESNGCDRQDAL
jgi:hypothetical protein